MTDRPELVEMVVEWTAGDRRRYEWDEATGALHPYADDRAPLHRRRYAWDERARAVRPAGDGRLPPEHYGCIRRTLAGDGEALDVFLLRDGAVRHPGERVQARLIAVLRRSDGDDKLVAVDPARTCLADAGHVDARRLESMWQFIRRRETILGWFGADEAYRVLREARHAWEHARG